jgi:hypothetical protein
MITPMDYNAQAARILARGDARSEPYRRGLVRSLEVCHRKATEQPPLPPLTQTLPYPLGSAEADAFFAGCERGHAEWNRRHAATQGNPAEAATGRQDGGQ